MFVFLLLFAAASAWLIARSSETISCSTYMAGAAPYTEQERLTKAVSLSYFAYGCEFAAQLGGTVSEILDCTKMGILQENFSIRRTDAQDAASAVLDTTTYIRNQIGSFRYLVDRKEENGGFYGVAFADDSAKCVWITCAGAISFADYFACAGLVVSPMLTAQEKAAFALYEQVLQSEAVRQQGYTVLLTGHSLGGALAAMVSRASGCPAVTVNGADGLGIDKANSILGEKPIAYEIVNYVTSPTNGRLLLMDGVQRLMFLGSYKAVDYRACKENGLTTDTHSVFSVLPMGE